MQKQCCSAGATYPVCTVVYAIELSVAGLYLLGVAVSRQYLIVSPHSHVW